MRQMTFAGTFVEIPLNLAAQLAMDFFHLFAVGVGGETAQCLGMFALETQQHFLWQRVSKPESDEVGGALPFDVRQVTARMNPGAQRIRRFVRNAARP